MKHLRIDTNKSVIYNIICCVIIFVCHFNMTVTGKVFEEKSQREGGQHLGILAMHIHVPQKSLKRVESPVYFSI